ncbi:MAG: TetR/AcrR family transcriptional regulator [Thermodesulfobacteriota bacterium]
MNNKSLNHDSRKDKETAIFAAACRVIREKGYHQARMADIAAAAGISYGLVYHYFRSKPDLFDALIEEWWRPLEEMTGRLVSADLPVEEKLRAIAWYFLDEYEKRPDLVHIFITEFSRSSANLTPERLQRFKNLMARTEEILRSAQGTGAIRTDLKARYLTYFFLGSVEALLSTMVLENQPLKDRNLKKRLADAVLTAFLEGARPVNKEG